MNTEMTASIAAREQMLRQLKRHEDVLALRARIGVEDDWLADVVSRLARAIAAEAVDPEPVAVDA